MARIPQDVVERLRAATRVTVLTGGGISAESGIPSFRDAHTGSWSRYDPNELATPQAFQRNPRLVWNWYRYRRQLAEAAEPNAGHYALVDLEQRFPDFTLVTQNIDGMHWRAGSRDILELQGNIGRVRCFECGQGADRWSDDEDGPPPCASCGGLLRPDVVWFGEGVSSRLLAKARQAAERAEVFICVGASAVVQPVAALPLHAFCSGAFVVEINPEETALSELTHRSLRGGVGDLLAELTRAVTGEERMQGGG